MKEKDEIIKRLKTTKIKKSLPCNKYKKVTFQFGKNYDMEKIYTANSNSTPTLQTAKPKIETIAFLLNYSKALDIKSSKSLGKIDYLLN